MGGNTKTNNKTFSASWRYATPLPSFFSVSVIKNVSTRTNSSSSWVDTCLDASAPSNPFSFAVMLSHCSTSIKLTGLLHVLQQLFGYTKPLLSWRLVVLRHIIWIGTAKIRNGLQERPNLSALSSAERSSSSGAFDVSSLSALLGPFPLPLGFPLSLAMLLLAPSS